MINSKTPTPKNLTLESVRQVIIENAERVKALGEWPEHKSIDSLISRIPTKEEAASGFDAGIACALNLIPLRKQRLSAILHGNYTPQAIKQIQTEIDAEDFVDTETCWWLSGCYFCKEGEQTEEDFLATIKTFTSITKDKWTREQLAKSEWLKMQKSFTTVSGVALALKDGGMQAAYVYGHPVAIQPMHGIWFVGTYYESLGIPDDFEWSQETDEKGRLKSGPVFGSKQFVKCATFEELTQILKYLIHV